MRAEAHSHGQNLSTCRSSSEKRTQQCLEPTRLLGDRQSVPKRRTLDNIQRRVRDKCPTFCAWRWSEIVLAPREVKRRSTNSTNSAPGGILSSFASSKSKQIDVTMAIVACDWFSVSFELRCRFFYPCRVQGCPYPFIIRIVRQPTDGRMERLQYLPHFLTKSLRR